MVARPIGVSPINYGEITVPREVFAPDIGPRMIKRNFLQCYRIDGCGFDVLEVVAALTGERQIVPSALPSGIKWNDVFVGEGSRRLGFLADAILAAEIGTFLD